MVKKNDLAEYSAKRSFDATPEPEAHVATGRQGPLLFVVQQHAARQLHYDFRLECDGVLLSWAVPKGPSLDPSTKRLAMQVEDHPLEYGTFEGVIPEGYGAGSVMLWDRGWWEPAVAKSPEEMLEKGDFKFILHGEKLRDEFVLARMKTAKGNEWLLIKKKAAEARPGWDVEQYADSVAIAPDDASFVRAVGEAMEADPVVVRERGQAVARRNTWKDRADGLLRIMEDVAALRSRGMPGG